MADAAGYLVVDAKNFSFYGVSEREAVFLGYTAPTPPPTPPTPDTTPPLVSVVSPSAGSQITENTPLVINVTDNSGSLLKVFLYAYFPNTGLKEVIHDGSSFAPFYSALSARSNISGGFQYSILRSGGWEASPTITAIPLDAAGNESV